MIKVMNVANTCCNFGPISLTCPSTPCPTAATITNETVASKNGVVSSPVTFRNPTIIPNTISTETMSAFNSQNPAAIAITIPTKKDQDPTFCTSVCFFSILKNPDIRALCVLMKDFSPPICLFNLFGKSFLLYIFITTQQYSKEFFSLA